MAISLTGTSEFGAVRYILEVWVGGVLTRAINLQVVNSYAIDLDPSTDFQHTFGVDPIEDHSGFRDVSIAISGRSGRKSRLGQDRHGNPKFARGDELFLELKNFLADYIALAIDPGQSATAFSTFFPQFAPTNSKVRLVFRALYEQDEYSVQLVQFRPKRSVGNSKFSYEWSLQLRGYAPAPTRQPSALEAFFETYSAIAKTAADTVNSITAYVAWLDVVTKAATSTGAAYIEPIRAVGRLFGQVTALSNSGQAALELPAAFVSAALDVAEDAALAASEIWESVPYVDREDQRDAYFTAVAGIGDVRRAMQEWLGQKRIRHRPVSGANIGLLIAGYATATKTSPLVVTYTVQSGDTLDSIAQSKLGDVTLASVIADINGMVDYVTMPDGSPLGPGAVLILPDGSGVSTQAISGTGPSDVFGIDLKLDEEGDLIVLGTDASDVATIRGPALLKQALRNRLLTVQGQHGVFPAYGLPRLVGEPGRSSTAGYVASTGRYQVLADPRIKAVDDVSVIDGGDSYEFHCSATPRAGPVIDISVPSP